KITQTSQAKNKIRAFFKKQRREENIAKGKDLVEKEIRSMDIEPKLALTEENLQRVYERFNFTSEEDLYAAVGYQGITAALVATRLTDKIRQTRQKEQDLAQTLEEAKNEFKDKKKYK